MAILVTLVLLGSLLVGAVLGNVLHGLISPRKRVPWNWRLLIPFWFSPYADWRHEHYPDWWME